MVRKPRIHFPGAFYHVIIRWNRREKIFGNEKDYTLYLNFLSEYKNRYGFSLYAYTLMPNHALCWASHNSSICTVKQRVGHCHWSWGYCSAGVCGKYQQKLLQSWQGERSWIYDRYNSHPWQCSSYLQCIFLLEQRFLFRKDNNVFLSLPSYLNWSIICLSNTISISLIFFRL